MTNNISDKYKTDFTKLQANSNYLNKTRDSAMENFHLVGLPTARRGNEKWKYTNIAPIAATEFRLSEGSNVDLNNIRKQAFLDDSWINLIFVDGKFNSELSDDIDLDSISITNPFTFEPFGEENQINPNDSVIIYISTYFLIHSVHPRRPTNQGLK